MAEGGGLGILLPSMGEVELAPGPAKGRPEDRLRETDGVEAWAAQLLLPPNRPPSTLAATSPAARPPTAAPAVLFWLFCGR